MQEAKATVSYPQPHLSQATQLPRPAATDYDQQQHQQQQQPGQPPAPGLPQHPAVPHTSTAHQLRPAATSAWQPPAPGLPIPAPSPTSTRPPPAPRRSLRSPWGVELSLSRHVVCSRCRGTCWPTMTQLVLLGSQQQPALPAHQPTERGVPPPRGVSASPSAAPPMLPLPLPTDQQRSAPSLPGAGQGAGASRRGA